MGSCRASSKIPSWSTSLLHIHIVLAVLAYKCSCEQPQLVNPNDNDPGFDPNLDQFWSYPLGRAGYPLNDSPPAPPSPSPFPATTQPGGATFYPGPIPGTVQVGYFSGPSVASTFPPGSYGFNGNGVFGFNIPASAIAQQQQQSTNQQSPWGSGFWSRFNPVNRVGSLFNFPQRPPVHQYAFSASITNTPNNRQQTNPTTPANNQAITNHPYFYPSYNPQSDYKPWYNPAGYVPPGFGNPFYFPQQNPTYPGFNNVGYPQTSDQTSTDNTNKHPYAPKPSIPVYNPPNIQDNSDGSGAQNNATGPSDISSSSYSSNQPIRTVSPAEANRPGFWGENLRRNWLHVPWIGNFVNRDGSPRTEYPGATLFSLQG